MSHLHISKCNMMFPSDQQSSCTLLLIVWAGTRWIEAVFNVFNLHKNWKLITKALSLLDSSQHEQLYSAQSPWNKQTQFWLFLSHFNPFSVRKEIIYYCSCLSNQNNNLFTSQKQGDFNGTSIDSDILLLCVWTCRQELEYHKNFTI